MVALRALTFVRWIYGTGVVLALNEQLVRLCCWVCAWIGRWLMQYQVAISSSYTLTTMPMHWYSFDECMERVSLVLALNEQHVRVYCLNSTLLPVVDAIWGRRRLLISPWCAVQIIHWNGDDGSACVDLRSLNVWNGCCVGTKRTARTFVLLRVRMDCAVLFVINAVSGRNFELIYTHCNADGGCALIFIWWMHGMGVVLALNEQCVRLYCLNLTRVIGDRCSMRS